MRNEMVSGCRAVHIMFATSQRIVKVAMMTSSRGVARRDLALYYIDWSRRLVGPCYIAPSFLTLVGSFPEMGGRRCPPSPAESHKISFKCGSDRMATCGDRAILLAVIDSPAPRRLRLRLVYGRQLGHGPAEAVRTYISRFARRH